MPFALVDSVELELLIEGERNDLFQKITRMGETPIEVKDSIDLTSFSVQKIYLSSDGNELVFEVTHQFAKLYYYAFKFKGYLCCPAFLAEFFGLTDYACLKVSNGSVYFYIFLKEKVDDVWSKMLEGDSGLQGIHHFSAPVDEDKVLFLDSINKDTLFLITAEDFFMLEDIEEFLIYVQKPGSNPVQRSLSNPCYGYVREDLKDALNVKYCDLFEGFIRCESTAVVHVNSAIYKKVFELNNPQAQIESENKTISLMKVYEETGYAREVYILDKLTDHLKRNYENGKDKKVGEYYCAMFTILQSSGYGKSRLMERLGSRIPTFYSSLQPGIGYPKASFFLKRVIQELGEAVKKGVLDEKKTKDTGTASYEYCYMNNLSTAVYIYILRILYLILTDKKNEDQKLSRYFEIDSAITKHHLFEGVVGTEKEERIFQVLFKDLEKVCLSDTNIIFNGQDTINYNRTLGLMYHLNL